MATLAVGVFVARAALRQAKIAWLRHEEQTRADHQRRITETFTKAVEQLGSDKLQVRLGGIYALERISRESADDYWSVMEILTGFVRERARWRVTEDDAISETVARLYEERRGSDEGRRSPATDIAGVLTVIKRRSEAGQMYEREKRLQLNLSRSNLEGADLRHVSLEGADLSEANLECADFGEARLGRADLRGAHLQHATLRAAQLELANFRGARLEGAVLRRAFLQAADFRGAHLERASFAYSRLERADFTGTHLDGARFEATDLSNAYGLMQHQIDTTLGDRVTTLPRWMTRPPHWPSVSKDITD